LIAVGQPRVEQDSLNLDVAQVGLLNGLPVTFRGGPVQIPMHGICKPGEIRLYAGQADQNDASRFSIPFEARGRRGWIDGTFSPPTHEKTPDGLVLESGMECEVTFSVRVAPATTKPATAPAP
jgi:hypothetical protein